MRSLTELRYPEAVSLTLVIKEMLSQRALNEAYTGGLSSYAVLLMVVAVLQVKIVWFLCSNSFSGCSNNFIFYLASTSHALST